MHGIVNSGFDVDDKDDKGSVEILGIRPLSQDQESDTFSISAYQKAAAQLAAISVRNGEKSYRGKNGQPVIVLKGFNMTVPKGSIYSLLGSSGCGKTTVLKAAVGVQHLDDGDVKVFGESPGTRQCGIPGRLVGYMPQDAALYNDFTIAEILSYFGRIYFMSKTKVAERSEFLVSLLQLPDSSRKIGTLSGGQQRRVSFAVALVHSPALLILDEPTVGVDPLLRQSIWKHLRQLATEYKTTVLITTHYISETIQSDVIGVMRHGRLLVEKNPSVMLEQYNKEFLEDVVLDLCHGDDDGIEVVDYDSVNCNTGNSASFLAIPYSESDMKDGNKEQADSDTKDAHWLPASCLHVQAVISKTVTLYFRNYMFLIFTLTFPISQVLVSALTLGNKPIDPKFGVVNHDSLKANCSHFSLLNYPAGDCGMEDISCHYLSKIDPTDVTLINFPTIEDARNEVKEGNIWGLMEFSQNFSTSFYTLQETSDVTGSNGKFPHMIHFEMDMSNKLVTQFLQKLFFQAYETFLTEYKGSCGYDSRVGQTPLRVEELVGGQSDDADIRDYVLVSTLVVPLFFFPMISSSFWFIFDKKSGTQSRTIVAGMKLWELMLGSYLVEIPLMVIQWAASFVAVWVICGISVKGSILLAFGLCMLIGLCGVSLGFLIATVCSEEFHVGMSLMGLFLPNFLLAGLIWTRKSMPIFLQYITFFMPSTLPGESLRSIVNRGVGFTHSGVWPGFIIMAVYTATYWVLIILIEHYRGKSPALKKKKVKVPPAMDKKALDTPKTFEVKYNQ